MSSEIEEFLGFATRVIVFRDGAPFDALDGQVLEPKRVLEAMFGQTTGAGLNTAHGLVPKRAVVASGNTTLPGDGVRVEVAVPPEIKAAMKAAQGGLVRHQVAVERVVPAQAPEVKLAPKAIRIVEFDADGRRREGTRR
jgi:ribose transport system ATP-binding protein